MQNIKQLRENLAQDYEQMKLGRMKIATGKALANSAGKILTSLQVELEYCKLTGVEKDIDFLKTGEETRLS